MNNLLKRWKALPTARKIFLFGFALTLLSMPFVIFQSSFKSQTYKTKASEITTGTKSLAISASTAKNGALPDELIIKLKDKSVKNSNLNTPALDTNEISFSSVAKTNVPKPLSTLDSVYKIKSIQKVFKKLPRSTKKGKLKTAPAENPAPIYLIKFNKQTPLENAMKLLKNMSDVEYVEFNLVLKASYIPNDPYYKDASPSASERSLAVGANGWNPPFDYQWGLKKINPEGAWNVTKGDPNVVVAVVDSGVDYTHPELAGRVIAGYNFVAGNNDPMDDHGHGTHVAGIIGASIDNDYGIAGVNPNAQILAVKGLDSGGSGTLANLAAAIDYARVNGVRVINASWGGSGDTQTLKDAVDSAVRAGIIFVAAAGNDGVDSRWSVPAKYRSVFTVGSSDTSDQASNFSNKIGLDFVAPGGNSTTDVNMRNILSLRSKLSIIDAGRPELTVGSKFLRLAGTSMAAPYVAGAASILLSANPNLTVEEVRSLLKQTAYNSSGAVWSPELGYGRIDLSKSASLIGKTNTARVISPEGPNFDSTDVNTITFLVGGQFVDHWILEYGLSQNPNTWLSIAQGTSTGLLSAPLSTANFTHDAYTLRLKVYSTAGSLAPLVEDRLILNKSLSENWHANPPDAQFTGGVTVGQLTSSGEKYVFVPSSLGLRIYNKSGLLTNSIVWNSTDSPCSNFETPIVTKLLPNIPGNQILIPLCDASNKMYLHLYKNDGQEYKNTNWPKYIGVTGLDGSYPPGTSTFSVAEVTPNNTFYILIAYGNTIQIIDGEGNSINSNWPKTTQNNYFEKIYANSFFPDTGNNLQILTVDDAGKADIFDVNGHSLSSFTIPTGNRYSSFVITDIDNDGFKNIVFKYAVGGDIYYSNQKVAAYKPSGEVMWEQIIGPSGLNTGFSTPIVADINGDGKNEIITNDANQIVVFDLNGNKLPSWSNINQPNVLNLAAADLNNDGTSDIYFDTSIPPFVGSLSNGNLKYIFSFPGMLFFYGPTIVSLSSNNLSLLVAAPLGSSLVSYDVGKSDFAQPNISWPMLKHDETRSNSDGVCINTACDLNRDGVVSASDSAFFKSCYGKGPLLGNCRTADLNCDSYTSLLDFSKFAKQCPAAQ